MKQFRRLIFWLHLTAGAIAAAVVVVMSATGVLLTYQKQITAWADRRAVQATPPAVGSARLGVDELLERAHAQAGVNPTAITLRSRADAPAEIAFGRERRELANIYTGTLLGQETTTRAFFRSVTAWHRTLAATGDNRALGKAVTGAANLAFLFLVVSGFYLWWPRNWSPAALRNVTWFRRRLSGKARDFNWHNTIGFWSAIPLFVIVLSGVVISYQWAGNLVYRAVGEKPPAPAAPQSAPARGTATRSDGEREQVASTSLDALFAAGRTRAPEWTSMTLTLPTGSSRTATLAIDRGTGGQPHLRSTLVLDRASATEVRYEEFASQSRGRRIRSVLRFAHTGEVLGIVGQTIAGLASLGSVVLAITGITLALRRLSMWRRRRSWRREDDPREGTDVEAAA